MADKDRDFVGLLKNWLSGDLWRADAERLQSLTEGDDFRREAFEGFCEQSEKVDERQVSAMRARFEKKYGRKKTRSMPMTWAMAAAACALLAFGTIWLFEKTGETAGEQATPQIAMQKETAPAEPQPQNPPSEADLQDTKPKPAKPSSDGPVFQKRKDDADKAADRQTESPSQKAENEVAAAPTKPAPAEERLAAGDAVASAPPIETRDEAKEKASTVAPGTSRSMPVDVAEKAKKAVPKPAAPAAGAAAKQADDLSEVVVSSAKKKREADRQPAPENGWENFNDYISKNMKRPPSAPSGAVELTFKVDKNGRPTAISFSKKLGGGCDEEAVRLLENGPNWSPIGQKGRVSIQF